MMLDDFLPYFPGLSHDYKMMLSLIITAMMSTQVSASINNLHGHFLKDIAGFGLRSYYNALKTPSLSWTSFVTRTARMAVNLISPECAHFPIILAVDDTLSSKFGKKFENCAKLYDHAHHDGKDYIFGHCFVSLVISVPVYFPGIGNRKGHVWYLPIPVGYRMWVPGKESFDQYGTKKREPAEKSKIKIAAEMIEVVMTCLKDKQVVLTCDAWYPKAEIVRLVKAYDNLSLVANVRVNTAIYALPATDPAAPKKRGRPAMKGEKLSIRNTDDWTCVTIGDYLVYSRKVKTNLFGLDTIVTAYVTQKKDGKGTRRLFISTIDMASFIFDCTLMKDKDLFSARSGKMKQFIPYMLYDNRWAIEKTYYEMKTFWHLTEYRVRSAQGIETLVNLINVAYAYSIMLPYRNEDYADLKGLSPQVIRYTFSRNVQKEIIIAEYLREKRAM